MVLEACRKYGIDQCGNRRGGVPLLQANDVKLSLDNIVWGQEVTAECYPNGHDHGSGDSYTEPMQRKLTNKYNTTDEMS